MPDFLKALDELEKQDALRAKTSIKQETLEGRIITSVDNTGSSEHGVAEVAGVAGLWGVSRSP